MVDDNPELLTLLSSSFEEAGYTVHTAARGRAALDLARKEKPALALVDILLPDVMGYDVAEALKRLRIPFLFMSGVHKGGKTSATVLSKYGALGFFEKPFERRALLDAVRKAVPVSSPGRQSLAFDVEEGPQVSEAAEAMQLTARIDLKGGSMRGTSPLRLRPMDRDQMNRLGSSISARTVQTGPIALASQGAPALQPFGEKDGMRRGDLKDNLPHLLAAFYNAKETGELGLMKGQVKKIIFFEQGFPVFALSNLVADRLGHFLVRAGKIDEATLQRAAQGASGTRQRTGDALIAMGALTEEERLYYMGQQIKSILYSVFAWEEGVFTLSFQARARREAIKLDIHPANLIMRGVKKLYKPERLKRLMPPRARPTPSQDPSFNLSDVELQAWEAHLLPRCDGYRTVADLLTATERPATEVLGSLVALTSLRVLELR